MPVANFDVLRIHLSISAADAAGNLYNLPDVHQGSASESDTLWRTCRNPGRVSRNVYLTQINCKKDKIELPA
jgi:hypothetical protein